MTVSQYSEKRGEPAVLTAADHLDRRDRELPALPEAVVLAFQPSLVKAVARRADRRHAFAGGNLYVLREGRVGVLGDFGFGAPVAAALVEYLAELGVGTVTILGGGGGLQPDLHGEEALVVEAAIRDEGVSHHYLEPARSVEATPALVERFKRAFADAPVDHRVGTAWTTDAIFRETVPEVERYADEGVLAVEMEAAAVFAVAACRGLDAGAVLTASDALRPDECVPHLEGERRLERLLPHVVDALVAHACDAREPE
jgi:uridine phosphorylase